MPAFSAAPPRTGARGLLLLGLALVAVLVAPVAPFGVPRAAAAADGVSVSNGAPPSTRPGISASADGGRVCVTWTSFDQSPNRAYARVSQSGAWRPDLGAAPIDLTKGAGGSAQGNTAQCAIDGSGRVVAVWVEYPGGILRTSTLQPGADPGNVAAWSGPATIAFGADAQNPDIAAVLGDAGGTSWLAYWSLDAGGVFVRSGSDGNWGAPVQIATGGKHPRIEVDNAGFVHVVYQQSGQGITYTYRDPGTGAWSAPVTVPGSQNAIEQTGITVSRDTGDVHVVYSVAQGADDSTRVVFYAKKSGRTGTAFAAPRALTGQGNHVVPRVAWGTGGQLTMVSDKRDQRVITIAQSPDNGATWTAATDLTTATGGQWPAVTGVAGGAAVAYWAGTSIFVTTVGSATPPPPPPACPPSATTGFTCWTSLGGVLTDAPAVAGFNGRIYAFASGTDPQNAAVHPLYTRSSADGATWTAWENLGGNLTAAPAAAALNGRLYVLAKGVDPANAAIHPLYVRAFDGSGWTPWASLGGNLTDAPAAAAVNGTLYALAKGVDPQNPRVFPLYLRSSRDGVNWTPWVSLGGNLTAAPAAAGFRGRLYVFASGVDPSNTAVRPLYLRSSADGVAFTDWQNLGGNLTAAPAAASATPAGGAETLFVLARGNDAALYVRQSADGSSFDSWRSLGGAFRDAPAAAGFNNRLVVLGRGTDNTLVERHTLP